MSIKRYGADGFTDLTTAKRFNGEDWDNLTIAKRFDGENWVDLLSGDTPSSGNTGKRTTAVFNIKSKTTYWGSGARDNQYPSELIQGSYNGGSSASRNTLIFFDNTAIAKSIPSGAVVKKVELYIQRASSAHGAALSYAGIKYVELSSAPITFTGSGMKDAAENMPSFNLGEGKWITLNSSVLDMIRSGTKMCFALSSGNDYRLNKYGRYARAATKLRVTYSI